MPESTTRDPRSSGKTALSNGGFGTAITKLVLVAYPALNPEIVPYVGIGVVMVLGFMGSFSRDLMHEYEADGNELHWFGRAIAKALG